MDCIGIVALLWLLISVRVQEKTFHIYSKQVYNVNIVQVKTICTYMNIFGW